MRITGYVWLEDVVEKLYQKHRVTQTEVEEVIEGRPKFRKMKKGRFAGEDVYLAAGRTHEGRYLVVFFIWKTEGEALILSARDMDEKERKSYAKK